jgi:hypothetical protein
MSFLRAPPGCLLDHKGEKHHGEDSDDWVGTFCVRTAKIMPMNLDPL